tara:strand:+ start:1536 stop:2252 length:717 start_codon:yes stop_codon:yes gene_type:complete
MMLIKPDCRDRHSAQDVEFIVRSLGDKLNQSALTDLLTDPDARDLLLDDPDLRAAIQNSPILTGISAHLYFYILVRHELLEAGIDDRTLTDYIAEMLTEYSDADSVKARLPESARSDYVVDLMAALQTANRQTAFQIHAHVGNHTLLPSGIFPNNIKACTDRRGAPDIGYHEHMGAANYRMASHLPLVQKYDIAGVLESLADRFHDTRPALNEFSDRFLSFDDVKMPNLTPEALFSKS